MVERDASILAPLAGFYAAPGAAAGRASVRSTRSTAAELRELLRAPEPLTPRLEDRHGETLRCACWSAAASASAMRDAWCWCAATACRSCSVRSRSTSRVSPPTRRAEVLAETVPFGHILATAVADPDAFLRVVSDPLIAAALQLSSIGGWLYGRRRTVGDDAGATVATIVEILAPDGEG
jgi:hypothetical protein